MSEVAKLINDASYRKVALEMFERVLYWLKNPDVLGKPTVYY